MKKTAVIYWSGTGNTEAMAKAVLEGMRDGGADAVILTPDLVEASEIDKYDAIAFGCPAMGAEMLEDAEFEPMFSSVKDKLIGKNVALFGSYGWGEGDWMRNWEDDCGNAGITLSCDSVICNEAPDSGALSSCRDMGRLLAQ